MEFLLIIMKRGGWSSEANGLSAQISHVNTQVTWKIRKLEPYPPCTYYLENTRVWYLSCLLWKIDLFRVCLWRRNGRQLLLNCNKATSSASGHFPKPAPHPEPRSITRLVYDFLIFLPFSPRPRPVLGEPQITFPQFYQKWHLLRKRYDLWFRGRRQQLALLSDL